MATNRSSAARLLDFLLTAATLGIVTVSVLAVLAEASWMLELFSHFRLQYLGVQLPLLLACLLLRRWVLTALLVPFVAANATAVAGYWPRNQSSVAVANGIEIMSVNLYSGNDEHGRFIELARTEQPDILLLLEYTPAWAQALQPIEADYPFRAIEARADNFGVALYSRVPLIEARVIDVLGVPAVDAVLSPAETLQARFLGVHLLPPTSAREAHQRNAQLARLGELASAQPGPLIVAGDFNVTPYSPVLADWLERTSLSDTRRGRGFGMSWPASLPILGIPIDHVLVSEDFLVAAHYYGPAFGSDHYPVLTRLALRTE